MDGNLLNKGTSVALYRQLADALKQQFRDSELPDGARIPTEFDLAEKYGVSRGTVRQALRLLEEDGLIERVPGVGTFLRGEVPDARQENTRRIGIIVPFIEDEYRIDILVGVESVAKYRGYQVVFHYSNENLDEEKADIERMLNAQVAGFIIFPVSNVVSDDAILDLYKMKIPFVLVDRYFPDLDCDYVVSDNREGGYRAVEHLILAGHHEIGFIYHPQADFRTTSVFDRYLGYRKALEVYHIDFQEDWQVTIEDSLAGTKDEDSLLPYIAYLQLEQRPRAFFTVNDITAISLLAAAARLGIKVPDDLAVVGFDNLKIATQIEHPLTTINQERIELGARAAQLLLGRIDGHTGTPEHIVIPTSLVIRETCGARQRIMKNRLEEQGKPAE
jgi:GntR family transcriptional regulator, arabinose operon transcriptional repressor